MTETELDTKAKQLAHIEAYTAAGFALVPLCSITVPHNHSGRPCRTPGKVPTRTGWQQARPGQYKTDELMVNGYGVVLMLDDIVVDIDPRNFKPGDKPLERLVAKAGPLMPTYAVKSGGGGYHFYLKKPVGVHVVNALPDYPGIEFKSAGRHVTGPGSLHISGKHYVVASGNVKDIADAPTALLALITRPTEFSTSGTGQYVDDAETRGRYLAYLQDVARPSVEGQGGDANAYVVACKGRDLGLSPEVAYELMLDVWNPRCAPPWEEAELRTKVEHAYAYAQGAVGAEQPSADFAVTHVPAPEKPDWRLSPSGALTKSFHNLLQFFKHTPTGIRKVFGYDEFTSRVEFTNSAPWHEGKTPPHKGVGDSDLKLLKAHLATNWKFEMPLTNIEEAVVATAHANKFHPVREYLDSLVWDGKPRLDAWLTDYLGVEDSPYTRACARKVLCAAIMRVMRPGVKFDHVLVLEGRQGVGKSSVCRILAGEWGSDAPVDPHSKDTIHLMQGRWIIELAELEVTKRADLQALRAFITRSKDEARLAYQRTVQEFPRQSVFIGSINPGADGTYLKDDENRRWWPVACGNAAFDLKGLKEARNQILAEAVMRCKEGEPLHMHTKELRAEQRAQVDKRRAEHPWRERVEHWLKDVQAKPETRYDFLTVRDVYVGALGGADKSLDRYATAGIADVLKGLGWEQTSDGKRRGWVRAQDTMREPLDKNDPLA